MDLHDVGQRIFRRHWALILLLTLVGAAAPLLLVQDLGPSYVATARFVIGDDGLVKTDGTSLADTALGLATSSVVIDKVLKDAKLHEDPALVATEVTVAPVGTSGVLDLSVTDADAKAAAAIARGLVLTVVQERQAALQGANQALILQTTQQIAAVNQRIAAIENASHGYLTPGDSAGLALRHADALAIRNGLMNQKQQLLTQIANTQGANVIDDSVSSGVTDTSTLPAKVAVGALLGLVLGIAIAATREAMRPTYNASALSRHLDAPLLGRVQGTPTEHSTVTDPLLASYVGIAADRAGVDSVQLVPVGRRKVDVSGLARSLRKGGRDVVPLVLSGDGGSLDSGPNGFTAQHAGIVVVAPKVVTSTFLAALERHLQVTKQRVIGVITYSGRATPAPRQLENVDIPEQQAARPSQTAPAAATVS